MQFLGVTKQLSRGKQIIRTRLEEFRVGESANDANSTKGEHGFKRIGTDSLFLECDCWWVLGWRVLWKPRIQSEHDANLTRMLGGAQRKRYFPSESASDVLAELSGKAERLEFNELAESEVALGIGVEILLRGTSKRLERKARPKRTP